MDQNPNKPPYRDQPPKQYLSSSSSDEDNSEFEQENNSRRTGMRFGTIEEFLASLNTATTAVAALQGLQTLSVESYQKCMEGNVAEASAGDAAQQLKAKMEMNEKEKIDDDG